eukprot:Skav217853  [mRNA]  locus=scaffold5889:28568:31517:- [translate_table: standard]
MGCPKSFSVKGGMGAALLDKPEAGDIWRMVVAEIVTSLRRALPSDKSVTCKIRMLPSTDKTRDFMQVCEKSGAEAITVHMRLREERPAEPAHWDEMERLWDAVKAGAVAHRRVGCKVPVLANGDFFNRRQIDEFWKHCQDKGCRPSGVMIARGSQLSHAFLVEFPKEEMVRSYVRSAVATNSTYQNTKWVPWRQHCIGTPGTGVTVPTSFSGINMKVFNRESHGHRFGLLQ